MTTLAAAAVADSAAARGFWTRSRKAGVVYAVLGLLGFLLFAVLRNAEADVAVRFTGTTTWSAPSEPVVVVGTLLCALVGVVLFAMPDRIGFGPATGIALTALVVAFVFWSIALGSDHGLPVDALLRGSLLAAVPLIYGSLAGVLCERSGVVNVNIEGQLLVGAFAGALIGTVAASAWVGLVAAGIAGLLLAALLAWLSIRYLVDQVVLGVVLNILALGITGVLYQKLMQPDAQHYNQVPTLPQWNIPGLDRIPFLGTVLFTHNMFVYLALILVAVVSVALFRTRWGLRTRAVGEHPSAADTVGIRVLAVRYRNVMLGGLIAGVGGAYLTIGQPGDFGVFGKAMTAGQGFIALAALIFGRWSPVGALLAALLFGFATSVQSLLSSVGSPVPSQFLQMAPYLATIFAVAGLVGRVRAPAADGVPYVKG